MDILFIIRSQPDSASFDEAVTALLGASLFGQNIAYLLMGCAALTMADESSPLAQVAEMSLVEGYSYPDKSTALLASSWADSLKSVKAEEAKALINSARHVLSF